MSTPEREYLRELPRHIREHIASFQDGESRRNMRKVLKLWRATGEGLHMVQFDKIKNEVDNMFQRYLPKDPYAIPTFLTLPSLDKLGRYAKYMRQYDYGLPEYGLKPELEKLQKVITEVQTKLDSLVDKSVRLKNASPKDRGSEVVADLWSYFNFFGLADFLEKLEAEPQPEENDYYDFDNSEIGPTHTVNGPFIFGQIKLAVKTYGAVALSETEYNNVRDLYKSFVYKKSPIVNPEDSTDSYDYGKTIVPVMEDDEVEAHVRKKLLDAGVQLPSTSGGKGQAKAKTQGKAKAKAKAVQKKL